MLLNTLEFALVNNPLRAAVQRHFEARRLLEMGGPVPGGGRALEIGCGRGIGACLIVERFGANTVDGFDRDPRMVARARERLRPLGSRARLWVGDATAIPVAPETYDAVFDFGVIHHIPRWRLALREVSRVLKPGGRLYAEEMLERFICHPFVRRLLTHPQEDRFDADTFEAAIEEAGLTRRASRRFGAHVSLVTADKEPRGEPIVNLRP